MKSAKALLAVVVAVGVLIPPAPAQAAGSYGLKCDVNQWWCAWVDEPDMAVGDCGYLKSGPQVRAVQTIFWAAGLLSSSQIDGAWGPITRAAAKTWQAEHGLAADGCIGWRSVNAMQTGSHLRNVGGESVRFYHLQYFGEWTDNDTYTWWVHEYREANKNNGRVAIFRYLTRNEGCGVVGCPGYEWRVYPPNGGSYTFVWYHSKPPSQ